MATKHLIDKGHRKIAYVTAKLDRPSRAGIYQGYRDAMRQYGIEPLDAWIQISQSAEEDMLDGTYEFANGKLLAHHLLTISERPTAIFACNDMTACGVIHELVSNDIRVPEQISVIGFDNIALGQMVTPSLTTIEQPNYEMGKLACSTLIDRLNGISANDNELLQPKLIERLSVAAQSW